MRGDVVVASEGWNFMPNSGIQGHAFLEMEPLGDPRLGTKCQVKANGIRQAINEELVLSDDVTYHHVISMCIIDGNLLLDKYSAHDAGSCISCICLLFSPLSFLD